MQATVHFYQERLALKATLLIGRLKNPVNAINNRAAVSDYLPYNIALEWVAFANRVISASFRLMLKCAAVHAFPDIKRPAIRPAKYIDVEAAGD
ncbi:MAG: hypothetical protein ACP5QR_10780 [Rhizomicrobium sp.]